MIFTLSLPPGYDLETLHAFQDEAIRIAQNTSVPDFDGAGIIMVAGGRCFTGAYVALTHLREVVGCTLPIQIWYLGPEEMSPTMINILQRFDVDLVNAEDIQRNNPIQNLGGWECKAFALCHSPFRHVILLDTDNVPMIDPAEILRWPEYEETGAIFWPDNHTHSKDSPVWKLFRVPYRHELEVESGQLAVDKARCWLPLNLALHFNDRSDLYYRYIYGDKETFHFAWRQLDQPYAMPPNRPEIVYCHKDTPFGRRRMTAALEQRDFAGRVIFHHRTGAEWSLFGENYRTDRQALEAVSDEAIRRLRCQWDGRILADDQIFINPAPIQTNRPYRFRQLGVSEHSITFSQTGEILATPETHWTWRLESNNPPTLVIANDDGEMCRLAQDTDGIWRGRQLWYQRVPVELVPHEHASTGWQRNAAHQHGVKNNVSSIMA